MKYQAISKYIKVTPRKLGLIADAVKFCRVDEALMKLANMSRKNSIAPLVKTINSAVANAKQKNVSSEVLKIEAIEIMKGAFIKRWHAASRGRAHQYKKRMSHIKVVLSEDEKGGGQHGPKSKS